MPNVFQEHIWILDTQSSDPVTTDDVFIDAIRWVAEGAAAGSNVILTNAAGQVVWESVATGVNYVEESRVPVLSRGLIVDTLDSGTLYLYHLLLPKR